MAGTLKIGGVPIATHSDATAKVSLDSGLTFPAGHVLQVVQSIKSSADLNSGSIVSGTNTTAETTPDSIISFFQTGIQPISATSKILVEFTTNLASGREGPSNAYGGISFYESATSNPAITINDMTVLNDKLYIHRQSVSDGAWSATQSGEYVFNTGIMKFLHTHNVSSGNYAVYSHTVYTTYTNLSQTWRINTNAINYVVTLMEIM